MAPWGSRSIAALNWLTVTDSTTCAGRQCHASTTLCEKQCLRISSLALGFSSLNLCPLDCLLLMWKNVSGATFTSPFTILNTSIRSPLLGLFSSLISPVFFKRSSYGNVDMHLIILVTLLCTLSKASMSFLRYVYDAAPNTRSRLFALHTLCVSTISTTCTYPLSKYLYHVSGRDD